MAHSSPSLSSVSTSLLLLLPTLPPSRDLRHLHNSLTTLESHLSTPLFLDPAQTSSLLHALRSLHDTLRSHSLRSVRPRLPPAHPQKLPHADRRLVAVTAHKIDSTIQVAAFRMAPTPPLPPPRRVPRLFSVPDPHAVPWRFSTVQFPLTPLRSRRLEGETCIAMWKGERVRVRVMRGDVGTWKKEGDYLFNAAMCRSVHKFLGGAWEQGRSGVGGVGYLVMQAVGGISLERAVREGRLRGVVQGLRVLERVVAAVETVERLGGWHGDLCPSNVVLVEGEGDVVIDDKKYGVSVVDFATLGEIKKGRRDKVWWKGKGEDMEGWCPPENVTPDMWRRLGEKRDRERRSIRGRWAVRGRMSSAKQPQDDDDASEGDRAGRRGFLRSNFDRGDEHTSKSTLSEKSVGGKAVENKMVKADVWSMGWLLYYMCTGRHPHPEAWAGRGSVETKEKDLRREATCLIRLCTERDVGNRASLREMKRALESVLQGLMFERGVEIVSSDGEKGSELLDRAVGIGIRDGEVVGLNERTRKGLRCLPVAVVRRVEWEAAGRYLGRNEDEIANMRRKLVNERWSKIDVTDGEEAVQYLRGKSIEGVVSAKSALGWVYRWGAGGVKKDVTEAVRLWEEVWMYDAEAANGLGLIFHYGRNGIQVDGKRAKRYYERAVWWGYCAAAVNLGVLLHDGAKGVERDGVGAKEMYEMGARGGDGIAANNLGVLLWRGGRGVEKDWKEATRWFFDAVQRGERKHASRNLGELWWERGEFTKAVECFGNAMQGGDESSRRVAYERLRKLVRTAEEADAIDVQVLNICQRLLNNIQ